MNEVLEHLAECEAWIPLLDSIGRVARKPRAHRSVGLLDVASLA
jgi:hypothetical protein